MKMKTIGSIAIILSSIFGLLAIMSLGPIAQDIEYHSFQDQCMYFGTPNFVNVVSNVPFLIVGCMGIYSIFFTHRLSFSPDMKTAFTLFFLGVSIVAVGSSYYHLAPGNETLMWDRLPMAIAFMSLFSIIISEFISSQYGKLLLWPLVIFGAFSVIYWQFTELTGKGDLRLYLLVQFLPLLVIPLILLFFKSNYTNVTGYWFLLLAYAIAKALEHFDSQIYNIFIVISGHSIKHIVAAFGIYLLLISFKSREQVYQRV